MAAKRKKPAGQIETQADVDSGVVVQPRRLGAPELVIKPRRTAPEIIMAVRRHDDAEQDG